jgi:nucleotide-binding universal stress UspA family protein
MSTIVAGYDGSPSSQRALDRAAWLAKLAGARLVVTSVVPVVIGGALPDTHGDELQEAAAAAREHGIEPELVEAIGDPAQAITEVAELHDAELIVVGTREPSLVERALGWSVSEQVQRRAHCDVLIVHAGRGETVVSD